MRILIALGLLLVGELECLLVTHYEIRTSIRQLLHLPVYHILLMLLTLAGLTRWLRPGAFEGLKPRFGPLALLLHLLSYGSLSLGLSGLFSALKVWPAAAAVSVWLGLGLWLLATWLASWLPISLWRQAVRQQGGWLWVALGLSLLAPYLAESTSGWWSGLAYVTFRTTDLFLLLLYPDSVCDTDSLLLGTSRFVVEVRPGCSGLEGMGLMALLAMAYLWLRRERLAFPQAYLLIPLGMAVVWMANILRLVALVTIGTFISPNLAMRGFHSQAGWISFTFIGLGVLWLTEARGWLTSSRPERQLAQTPHHPGLAYLAPLAAMLMGGMVVEAFTQDFPYLYVLKVVPAALALGYFHRDYQDIWGKPTVWGMLVGLAVFFVWLALVPAASAPSPYQMLAPEWALLWVLIRVLGTVLVVPLTEELAFRGYLMRRLEAVEFERVGWRSRGWLPILGSSLFFALLHTDRLAAFLAGLAYAGLCRPRARLSDAVLAHSLTNAGLAAWACTREAWWLLA